MKGLGKTASSGNGKVLRGAGGVDLRGELPSDRLRDQSEIVYAEPLFAVPHGLDLCSLARGFGWQATRVATSAAFGAALSVYLLDENNFAKDVGWRIAFGLGAVLGIAILIVRRYVPESPVRRGAVVVPWTTSAGATGRYGSERMYASISAIRVVQPLARVPPHLGTAIGGAGQFLALVIELGRLQRCRAEVHGRDNLAVPHL